MGFLYDESSDEIDLEFNIINSNYLKKVCVNKIVIPIHKSRPKIRSEVVI